MRKKVNAIKKNIANGFAIALSLLSQFGDNPRTNTELICDEISNDHKPYLLALMEAFSIGI